MNILISIDNKYLEYAKNMLESISHNNKEYLKIFLIHDSSLSENSIDNLNSFLSTNNIGELHTIYFDSNSLILPKYIDYITINTYYRLFAPYLLPTEIDRILYLDTDIICNGSIEELYNCTFDNNLIVGCENMLPEHLQIWRERNITRLELPKDYRYINAGVLLIDVKKYREKITKEEILEFIKENYEKLIFQDQDVINKLFMNRIKIIDKKYNYQINTVKENKIIDDIRLVHYSEQLKPWDTNYDEPLKGMFYYNILKKRKEYDLLKELVHNHYQNKERKVINSLINDK